MAINSRSKGQRGEREVRDILQKVMDEVGREMDLPFVPEVKRNLMQSMEGGHDLVGIPGLAVEVKFCETLQQEKWWDQAVVQGSRAGADPVLLYRKRNVKWRARLWGMLGISDYGHEDCFIAHPVDVSMDEFLTWFEGHLTAYWRENPPRVQDKNL
jgi:hypothetical protein